MSAHLPGPDLSIALDMVTLGITGELLLDERLAIWLEAGRAIAPKTFEIVICAKGDPALGSGLPPEIRLIPGRDLSYYGLKNEAARAARGDILFFADIDCRPDPHFFRHVLSYFDDPSVNIVGGRSYYDGSDLMTRANTATNFGYLHQISHLGPNETYLGHNIAVRRVAVPEPFGPYTNRYGGDEYISCRLRREGDPLIVAQDVVIHHETHAFSLVAMVERHLGEIVRNCFVRANRPPAPGEILREARRMSRLRWVGFKRQAPKFGFTKFERFRVRQVYRAYGALDVACALAICLWPGLLQRWFRHQYGVVATAIPVSYAPARIETGRERDRLQGGSAGAPPGGASSRNSGGPWWFNFYA